MHDEHVPDSPPPGRNADEAAVRPTHSRLALAAGVVAVAVVVSPAVLDRPDSYPLSTYPMFSRAIDPVVELPLAAGLTAAGTRVELSPELIAGTDEVIVAGGTVRAAVRRGTAAELCARIAARIVDSDRDDTARVTVLTERIDAIAHYTDDVVPEATTVHATCDVPT